MFENASAAWSVRLFYSGVAGFMVGITVLLPVSQFGERHGWSDLQIDVTALAHAILLGFNEACTVYAFQGRDLQKSLEDPALLTEEGAAVDLVTQGVLALPSGTHASTRRKGLVQLARVSRDFGYRAAACCLYASRMISAILVVLLRYYTFLLDLTFSKEALYEWLKWDVSDENNFKVNLIVIGCWLITLRYYTGNEVLLLYRAITGTSAEQGAHRLREQQGRCVPWVVFQKPVKWQRRLCILGGVMVATQFYFQLCMTVPSDVYLSVYNYFGNVHVALATLFAVVMGAFVLAVGVGTNVRALLYESRVSFENFCAGEAYIDLSQRVRHVFSYLLPLGLLPLIASFTIVGLYYPARYNPFGEEHLESLRLTLAVFFTVIESMKSYKVELPLGRSYLFPERAVRAESLGPDSGGYARLAGGEITQDASGGGTPGVEMAART